MILSSKNVKDQNVEGQNVETILNTKFMLESHRKGMEQGFTQSKYKKCIVAFRAAGEFTLEKLEFGAAAKPHSILEKTIKPKDVNLKIVRMTKDALKKQTVTKDNLKEMVRYLLCGLVGVWKNNAVVGLYLSSNCKGLHTFEKDNVTRDLNKNPVKVEVATLDDLLGLVSELYGEIVDQSNVNNTLYNLLEILSKYFITGDYDIHEILLKGSENNAKFSHIISESKEEASFLCELAGMIDSEKNGSNNCNMYIPNEFSPIQHGAQANYIKHMFMVEKEETLVSKVLLPDLNIAIYFPETKEWNIIYNFQDTTLPKKVKLTKEGKLPENDTLLDETTLLVTQSKEIISVLRSHGADIFGYWDFEDITNQLMQMNLSNNTPNKVADIINKHKEIVKNNINLLREERKILYADEKEINKINFQIYDLKDYLSALEKFEKENLEKI